MKKVQFWSEIGQARVLRAARHIPTQRSEQKNPDYPQDLETKAVVLNEV